MNELKIMEHEHSVKAYTVVKTNYNGIITFKLLRPICRKEIHELSTTTLINDKEKDKIIITCDKCNNIFFEKHLGMDRTNVQVKLTCIVCGNDQYNIDMIYDEIKFYYKETEILKLKKEDKVW